MATKNSFGKTVHNARKAKGWTLSDLEKASGLASSTLSLIERGELPPPREPRTSKLAHVLGLDKDRLLASAGKVDPQVVAFIAQTPDLPEILRALQEGKTAGLVERFQVICDGFVTEVPQI